MKRNEFFTTMNTTCKDEKVFGMTYVKANGETRIANCKLSDKDHPGKGIGMTRKDKELSNLFQYWDLDKESYRTAKLENILDVTIDGVKQVIED